MVVIVMDDSIQKLHELSMAPGRKTTLKYGELQPIPEALHEPEHTAPSLWISDIVGDDVQVLVPHRTTGS